MKKIVSAVFVLAAGIIFPQFSFAQSAGAGGGFASFLPIVLIFVFFYLFLLRPQQKKAKQHQQLLNALKKDDKVIAAGGIFATVVNVKDNNSVEVKIADGVNIIVSKPSITTVFVRQEEEAAKTPDIIKK